MKQLSLILVLLISLSSAQELVPAAQIALDKGEQAMQNALSTYTRQYPDQALWKEAIAQGKEAQRVAPNALEPVRFLAEVYSRSNWYGPAYKTWNEFLDAGGQLDAEAAPLYVEITSKLGFEAYRQKRSDDALNYYLNLIDIVPYDKEAYVWAARILLEEGKPKQAIPYWQTVVERDVTDKRAAYFLNVSKAQTEWGIDAATAFEEGVLLYEEGDLIRARERFARAVSFNEMYPEAWAWLGRVEFENANYQEAASYYQEATQLEPSNETYRYFYEESLRR